MADASSSGPKAILIAGPTASGKSRAAFGLAKRLGGAIINADSMQVYRELRILTARPSESEEASLPHRLYGTVAASDAYSVGSWLADVASVLEEMRAAGMLPVLVGGTGLYFKSLTEGLAPIPDVPEEVRAHWREEATRTDLAGLYAKLLARDPAMAAKLSQSDPQRIVRALEVIEATGVSLAEWQGATGTPVLSDAETLKLVIAPEREDVYAAIDARFDRMLDDGAIEEVSVLLALDLDPGLPAMRAHGVVELGSYLSGAVDLDQAVAKAKTESRRYAKRQMTWLRRFMVDWDWFPGADAAAAAAGAVTR